MPRRLPAVPCAPMSHHREPVTAMGPPPPSGPTRTPCSAAACCSARGQIPLHPDTGELVGDDPRPSRRGAAWRTSRPSARPPAPASPTRCGSPSTCATWAPSRAVNDVYAAFFAGDPPAASPSASPRCPGRAGRARRDRRADGLVRDHEPVAESISSRSSSPRCAVPTRRSPGRAAGPPRTPPPRPRAAGRRPRCRRGPSPPDTPRVAASRPSGNRPASRRRGARARSGRPPDGGPPPRCPSRAGAGTRGDSRA